MRNDLLRRIRNLAVAVLLALPLMLSVATVSSFADAGGSVTARVDLNKINKFGNVVLVGENDLLHPSDLEAADIEYGDIVTLTFRDQTLELPVTADYNEGDSGMAMVVLRRDKVVLAENMGEFASDYIADKSEFEDGSFAWSYKKGLQEPVVFTITLKSKGGMYERLGNDGLHYTDMRSDYPELSDWEYANFRPICTTGMGRNALYRTSSPVNPRHRRSKYADKAMEKAGIRTVVNLSDTQKGVESFKGFDDSYYSTSDYIPLNMSVNFLSDDFAADLAEGMRFIASHDGPYLIHCTEGKDRAGLASALIECLMGANYDEIVRDYMISFHNYYGIDPDDENYDKIAEDNIVKTLSEIYGVEDLKTADLAAEADEYFREAGMSRAEIDALKANLGRSYTTKTEALLAVIGGLAVIAAAYFLATRRG